MATLLRGTPIQYELKRENRFFLQFPTELNIESWLVHMVKRPEYKSNNVEIPYFNTKFHVIGQYTWSEFEIEFIDPIGPSTSQKLMEWVRLHSESLTGRQGYAAGYKKDLVLVAADPVGFTVEKWVMYQCQIIGADFGNNTYESDGLQKPKLTIQPDFCEQSF
jgi:hypothetical protein